jgi:hypothetical protein
MKKGRIALFVYLNTIDNSFSVINLLNCLKKNNYSVDVFLYNKSGMQQLFGEKISFFPNKELFGELSRDYLIQLFNVHFFLYFVKNSFNLLLKKRVTLFLSMLAFLSSRNTYCFCSFIFSKIQATDYSCVIGIEKDGLILADLLNIRHIPQIYYSLELFYDGPPTARMEGLEKLKFMILRQLEAEAHENSSATIIQDQNRADVLFSYNKVRKFQDLIFMPVAMPGAAFQARTTDLYKLLDIPENKKIILQIGGINPERFSLEIARSTKDWPEEYVLVLHGYLNDHYKQEILNIKSDKLYLSEKKLLYSEIPGIVASAYIGLVFYRIRDTNYYNNYFIGNSSGQLAHFLQCGIPIITNDVPDLRVLTSQYHCGVSIGSAESISDGIFSVSSNYEFYRNNAFACFEKKYQYNQYCEKFIWYLKNLESPS